MTDQNNQLSGISGFPNIIRMASRSNRLATLVSAFAFAFSGVSFYESVLKRPEISVFIPPVIQYGRDAGGDIEMFAIPITIANDGARTGTVLTMDLEVESLSATGDGLKAKSFFSGAIGEHPRDAQAVKQAFAPLSVVGRTVFSGTVRFFPKGNPFPKIVADKGDFRFTLKLITPRPDKPSWIDRMVDWALGGEVKPVMFERTMLYISEQGVNFRRDTIGMTPKDWRPPQKAEGG